MFFLLSMEHGPKHLWRWVSRKIFVLFYIKNSKTLCRKIPLWLYWKFHISCSNIFKWKFSTFSTEIFLIHNGEDGSQKEEKWINKYLLMKWLRLLFVAIFQFLTHMHGQVGAIHSNEGCETLTKKFYNGCLSRKKVKCHHLN